MLKQGIKIRKISPLKGFSMCLINFAYKVHHEFELVVGSNRDEFYNRPTAQVDYWMDAPHVLAGRDLEKNGTWMGVTKQGRFAALTNYREPNQTGGPKRSRGELVGDFLIGSEHPHAYIKNVQQRGKQYPGFNLIIGNLHNLYYFSNIENKIQLLEPGVYGLSNHLLDTPWPKVRKGKEGLEKCLHGQGDFITECIFSALRLEDVAPDDELPETGINLEWERNLSPLFIRTPLYGTRSSTVMLMSRKEVVYVERTYEGRDFKEKERRFLIGN
jgi:uncharacterized protein with NRDE domain